MSGSEDSKILLQSLNRIESALFDTNKAIGRLEQGQRNLESYVAAVSTNQKATQAALDSHKEKHADQGEQKQEKQWDRYFTVLSLVVSVGMGVFVAAVEYFKK